MAIDRPEICEHTLPAGTVCKRNGIPFELAADTVIRCHPENYRFADSHREQLSSNPTQAASPWVSPVTNSSSLVSIIGSSASRT